MARTKHSRTISKQSFRVCFCFRRIYKLRAVEPPEDVKHIFKRYSSENGTMTVDDLQRFLIEYQKDPDATKEDAQAIFNSVKHPKILLRKGLHLEAFFRYLLGDLNPPLKSRGVHNDMNAPLAHYYMYTGHNSYLTGNQISSDSSEEPIIRALQKGVRVIELDLWPNSTKDDIQVCHGGTLTSPVELIKCLCAIKDHAFVASEYPVVITFEDHLTPDLQAKVAKMVTKTFGEMLYCPDEELHEFPSPESLKKRVMISTKPPKEYLRTQSDVEAPPSRLPCPRRTVARRRRSPWSGNFGPVSRERGLSCVMSSGLILRIYSNRVPGVQRGFSGGPVPRRMINRYGRCRQAYKRSS